MNDGTMLATDAVSGMLKHRWKLIVAMLILGVIAGMLFSLRQTTRYTAQSILLVGGNDLPTALTLSVDPKSTGPLGADLPAVTQAALIASPPVAARVGKQLGLTDAATASMLDSVGVKAQTDNLYAINVDGPTAAAAAVRANAFATEYLAERAAKGRAVLNGLARTASKQAVAESAQASQINDSVAAALRLKNVNDVAPLRAQQAVLLEHATADSQTAASLTALAKSYAGGGSLSQPALASAATASPVVWRDIAFGGVLGLLVGLILGSVGEKLSDRIRSRADASEAAGAVVLMAVSKGGAAAQGASLRAQAHLGALALLNKSGGALKAHGIVVRAVSAKTDAAPIAAALAEAFLEQGRSASVTIMGSTMPVDAETSGDAAAGQDGRVHAGWLGEDPQPSAPGSTVSAKVGLRRVGGELQDARSASVRAVAPGRGRGLIVNLSGSHAAGTSDLATLVCGTPVVLVVTAGQDRHRQVRVAARELSLAGLAPLGVVLLKADARDRTVDVHDLCPVGAVPVDEGTHRLLP